MKFSIYRYNPETDRKPRMQDYELSEDHGAIMLLDALLLLKQQDDSLSFRRSCREGVCGSDGMNINGRNGLACILQLDTLKQPITLRPLPGLPVIRDLIVDLTQFYNQYRTVKPWLINNDPEPEIERLQSPEERARLDGLYECVLCACCSTACPSFWWNPDRFLGPAALLQASRLSERQPRSGYGRTSRRPRRSLSAVSLPYHHELHRRLSRRVLTLHKAIGHIRQLLLKRVL